MNKRQTIQLRPKKRFAALVAMSLAACAADSSDINASPTSVTSCNLDQDCNTNEVCLETICRPQATPAGQLFFSIEPPRSTGYVTTHFFLDAEESTKFDLSLTLPQPIEFAYQILNAKGERVSASITIEGTNRIVGSELVLSETYLANRTAQFKLIPDDYRIRFVPTDVNAPGVDTEFTVRETTQAKDFMLASEFRYIQGRVHQRSDSNVPLAGVTVKAYSQSSGLPSSTGTSDLEGKYTISLPDTEDTNFRVVAEIQDGVHPAWKYERFIRVEREEDRNLDIGFTQTSTVQQGQAQIRFLGDGRNGPEPIARASVTLTASAAFDAQVYKLSATTDDEGNVVIVRQTGNERISLIAANYELEIIPPRESIFARSIQALDLSQIRPENIIDKHLVLSRRVFVTGKVLSSNAQIVENTTVDLSYRPLASEMPSPGAMTTTDETGAFEAWLDPGQYLIRISPPTTGEPATQLPMAFSIIDVPHGAKSFEVPPIIISEGSIIRGVISGSRGEVIDKAEVEPHLLLEDKAVVSLDRIQVNELGHFQAIVPSSR